MVHTQHHFHKRKRASHRHQPHPERLQQRVDKLVYVAGIVTPLFTLPQVREIRVNHQTAGVSLIARVGYLFVAIIFCLYGILHQEKPLIIMHGSMAVLEILIVI